VRPEVIGQHKIRANALRGRVLFVVGSLEIGGAEQHVAQVATALKARGWAPELFAFTLGGPLTKRLEAEGVPIYGHHSPKWLMEFRHQRLKAYASLLITAAALLRLLWSRPPDVIHFFLPAAYLVGGIAATVAGMRPRIMSRRSLRNYQLAHPVYAWVEKLLHPRMDMICGNSRAVIRQLEQEGVDVHRLRLIYNGVDLWRFDLPSDCPLLRADIGISPSAFVIVMVANLIPYKGHADLLQALAIIQGELPAPWVFLAIGRDDGIGDELARQAEALGVEKNVRWLGSRTDVPELLRLADVGVLSSHQEGFSNAVLEGMAAGLPMVVTDVGGNREAVVDGETGSVVPAKDPGALAAAILAMANNPQRSEMGLRGRARIEQRFTLTKCVDAYVSLYSEFLVTRD